VARGPEHASRGKTRAWVLLPPQLPLDSAPTVHPARDAPQRRRSGAGRGRMLQEVRETLRTIRRVAGHA
jgi:hypothetical protein